MPVVIQVDKADMNPGRPYDIMFTTYVGNDTNRNAVVFNMDKFMIEVEDWPGGRDIPSEWMWTIFISRYVRIQLSLPYHELTPYFRFWMNTTN